MPAINKYECNMCGFNLPGGWGVCLYVIDDGGKRIHCGHPGEWQCVQEVLLKDHSTKGSHNERAPGNKEYRFHVPIRKYLPPELIQERTGFNSDCVCLDCLHQFEADLGESDWHPFECSIPPVPGKGRDKRECPKCKSSNIKTELELVGKTCPKCKKGSIIETWTGCIC